MPLANCQLPPIAHGESGSHSPTKSVTLVDMIYPYDNGTQTRWDRGEFQVQLLLAGQTRPFGFCDGTESDLAELRTRAESEGADDVRIERKPLKTGREVWTLGSVEQHT